MIIKGYLIMLAIVILVFVLSEFIYKNYNVNELILRKLIHIGMLFVWFIQYYFLKGSIHFYLLPLIFTILIIFIQKNNLFDFLEPDKKIGLMLYPFSVFIMSFYVYFYPVLIFYYGIALFVLALADGFAPIIAKLIKTRKIYRDKTISGSLTIYLVTFFILLFFKFNYIQSLSLTYILILSLLVTVIESVTGRYDNFFIPITLFIVLMINTHNVNMSLLISLYLMMIAMYKNSFNSIALITAFSFSMIISNAGDYVPFLVLLIVYILTIYSDKIKKDEHRNIYQVLSNVLPGVLSILLYILTKNKLFYKMYFPIMGAVLADTFASSIGSLSKRNPISIRTLKRIQKGESGGVSFLGLAASLLAGVTVASVYLAFNNDLKMFVIISLLSLLGSFIDSILGILFEVKYQCPKCNKITDKSIHCNINGELIKGYKFINNDAVNLLMNIIIFIISCLILK